jgi:DNA-binding response OmpR family regulator
VQISNLRRKIERDASKPERLVTVRGLGYKLLAA